MLRTRLRRRVLLVLCLAFTTVFIAALSTRAAQETSALINEALDKLVELQFDEVALPDAMKTIEDRYFVPIEADPTVWDLLPWGEQTTINATIKNKTLRDALTAITRKLGLTYEVKDEFVQLRPMPALQRLGRRSTVEELAALDLLASTPMDLANTQPTVGQLIAAVDQKLLDLKSPFAIENRSGESVQENQAVYVPRNATMMEALESLVKDTGATWYPWYKSIVVVPKEDQIRNQLGKTLSLRYSDADVSQVLTDLSQRSGVNFSIEPGAIQRIPPESRRIRLAFDNVTVRQALEHISGFTGLAHVVRPEGVYLWNPSSQSAAARDPAIGILTLDSGMQVLIPRSQVPPDILEYLQARTQREFVKIREMMEDEGFQPSTRPTTQPADDL